MSVRRIFVEKKPEFAVLAHDLKEEIASYLGIDTITDVRVLIRYDIEDVSEDTYQKALITIFSEPPVDFVYEEAFPSKEGDTIFSVEFLPGQFDQRADSAEQCVKLLNEEENPVIRSATTYVISGTLTAEQIEGIKSLCINPVDSRENNNAKPETLVTVFEQPQDVKIFDGFCGYGEAELKELYDSLNLAMTFKDFEHIHNYFKNEEKRDPSVTEIRVLDTYWSDHCRHTTFQTELKDVTFTKGDYNEPMEASYKQYLADREVLYKDRDDKFVCLMDLAVLAMKKLRREGKLEDLEESEEINACSIVVPVTIDGKEEEWLVNFKNETHNHPTEIEPFGGKEYAVRAVPANLFSVAKRELLMEMIDDLAEGNGSGTPDLINERVATMSCKAAVKGNHTLSFAEADKLIDELLELKNPYACPHGRPTIISMSKYELEKKFKRIV